MPITQYEVNPDIALKGQTYGDRESLPLTLPALPQITTIVIADAGPAAGEPWTFTARDDRVQQTYETINFLSGAAITDTLDEWVNALNANGRYRSLFTFTEDGTDTLTITARDTQSPYTFTTVPGGGATAVTTVTQISGGADLPLGTMVSRAGPGTMRAPTTGDVLANFAGFLFRTDANHFQDFDEAITGFDRARRGETKSIMYRGFGWVETEDAITDVNQSVFVRISGTGTAGDFRGTADGGNTVDVSTICSWQNTATAGGLAPVRFNVNP